MLRFRCSKCAAKLGVAPGLSGKIITCGACMAKLRVPDLGQDLAPKAAGSGQSAFPATSAAATGPTDTPVQRFPVDAPTDYVSSFPRARVGSLSLPPLPGPAGKADSPISLPVQVTAVAETEDPKPAGVTQPPTEPFVIEPRSDLAISDVDDYEGPAEVTTAQLVWEDAKFFARAALPYVAVLSLLVGTFVFRQPIKGWLTAADEQMRSLANSDVPDGDRTALDELEQASGAALPDGNSTELNGTEPATSDESPDQVLEAGNPERIVRERVIETNVQIALKSGQESGPGVIFRITNDNKAIVLTSRSVVDPLFSIGINNPDPSISDVSLTFADKSTAVGRITWVGSDGLDVALIETSEYPQHVRPAKCAGAPIGEGETLMFADIGKTWAVGYASVGKMSSSDKGKVTTFELAKTETSVVGGTALYNKDGNLIAIAGVPFPMDSQTTNGSLAMMLRELKLPTP